MTKLFIRINIYFILNQFVKKIHQPIKLMEYSNFCENVKAEVESIMGPDYNVRIESVLKNNRVTYDALLIMKKGENMAPTVCLNEYYAEYSRGREMADIVLEIIVWSEAHKNDIIVDIDKISDYTYMKEKIYVKVINAKMNEELLERLPHLYFCDLAIIAYWIIEEDGQRKGCANVTNAQMKLWNVNKQEMFDSAIYNTKEKYPPKLSHMSDVMKELLISKLNFADYRVGDDIHMDKALARAIEEIERMTEQKLYVLTNSRNRDGAVYMVMDDVLSKIANQLDSDFFIMPSSVHEVLILPKEDDVDHEQLKEMVVSVNEIHVQPEEVLSDVVYFYERNTGVVCKK